MRLAAPDSPTPKSGPRGDVVGVGLMGRGIARPRRGDRRPWARGAVRRSSSERCATSTRSAGRRRRARSLRRRPALGVPSLCAPAEVGSRYEIVSRRRHATGEIRGARGDAVWSPRCARQSHRRSALSRHLRTSGRAVRSRDRFLRRPERHRYFGHVRAQRTRTRPLARVAVFDGNHRSALCGVYRTCGNRPRAGRRRGSRSAPG